MNLPGFTAEASLDNASGGYKSEGRFAEAADNQTVVPQRMKLRDVHCSCDPSTDICVCDNGRVLHMTLGNL